MGRVEIKLSNHAVERFHLRVRSALEEQAARIELERLIEVGELCFEAPPWLVERAQQRADGYLVVGDIVLPLRGLPSGEMLALTCIPRGGISERARAGRNEIRAARGRRAKRQRNRHGAGLRRRLNPA